SGGYWPKIPLSTTGMAWAALSNASHIRSGFHAGDRRAERARISHRPAAAIDEGQEIAEDSIEFVRRFEIDRMATVRHHRERSGGGSPPSPRAQRREDSASKEWRASGTASLHRLSK